jgi:hypothetical protein
MWRFEQKGQLFMTLWELRYISKLQLFCENDAKITSNSFMKFAFKHLIKITPSCCIGIQDKGFRKTTSKDDIRVDAWYSGSISTIITFPISP